MLELIKEYGLTTRNPTEGKTIGVVSGNRL
jgi:hypothetical protein